LKVAGQRKELKSHPQQQGRPAPTNVTKVALCEAHVQVGFFPNFSTFRPSTLDHYFRSRVRSVWLPLDALPDRLEENWGLSNQDQNTFKQKLLVRQGDAAPVTVAEVPAVGPLPSQGLCKL
jgi:hypothetical protein